MAVPNSSHHDGSSLARVLDALFRRPGISRATIARETGLSRQTVGEVVSQLERQEIVRSTGQTRGAIGRPGTENIVSGDAAFGLGIDLGGTNMRLALVDLAGKIRAQTKTLTPTEGLDALCNSIEAAADQMFKASGIQGGSWNCLTIGIPGVVHPRTGLVRLAVNLPYLNGVRLGEYLEQRFGAAVLVDNDVNLAAIGEWLAIGEEIKDFVFLSIGTGIGMALVLDGKIRRGATGSTGEVGNLPVSGSVSTTLEEVIGARVLETRLKAIGKHGSVADALQIPEANLDLEAIELVTHVTNHMVEAILSITAIADPELIVLGGGIGLNEHIQKALSLRLSLIDADVPDVCASHWGDDAGLIGSTIETVRLLRSELLSPSISKPSAIRLDES